jgi:MFS family permease
MIRDDNTTALQADEAIAAALADEPERPSMRTVLRNRNFLLLWLGQGVSIFGDQFYIIALSILALALSDGSATALGSVLLLAGIPRALLMVFGGAVTDRFSPRTVMAWANLLRAITVGALAWLDLQGALTLPHLYLAAVVFGAVDAFFYPAYSAILPRLISRTHLEAGNALLQITVRLSIAIGPALGGWLIASMGTTVGLGLDALTFVIALVALLFIQLTPTEPGEAGVQAPNMLTSIVEGLRYVWKDRPLLYAMVIIAAVDVAASGTFGVGLPVLADRAMDGARSLGWMLSSFGVGSLVGIAIASVWRPRRIGVLFVSLTALFGVLFGLLGLSENLIVIMAIIALAGTVSGVFNIVGISWIQRRADDAVLGRVMSLIMLSSVGLQPFTFALAGLLADVSLGLLFGASSALVLGTAAILATRRDLIAMEQS